MFSAFSPGIMCADRAHIGTKDVSGGGALYQWDISFLNVTFDVAFDGIQLTAYFSVYILAQRKRRDHPRRMVLNP